MLKKRIAAVLVVKDKIVVQSINFKKYLPVGNPHIAVEFLNQWGIDEIILLDISARIKSLTPDFQTIKRVSEKCHVPLTVGGGIRGIADIMELMHCGADKIAINQIALSNHNLITEAANIFGNQCVVVSIDAIKTANGYKVYDYINKNALNISPEVWAYKAEQLGAGEILINSVDKDGSYSGYDIELINLVCQKVSIPVIACGGARNAQHFSEVFSKTSVSAASAANFFHFTEHSVNITKAVIQKDVNIRFETHADYRENPLDMDFRLTKKGDKVLEKLLFVRIEKEII